MTVQQRISALADSPVLKNLSSLYGIHTANTVFPLILLPYLTRTLGVSAWGQYSFADAWARTINLCVEYGFVLSATRDIARLHDDPAERGRIIAGVFGTKLLLGTLAAILTLVLCSTVSVFANSAALVLAGIFWGVSLALNVTWYFQGLESLKVIAPIDIGTKFAATVPLFWLVRGPEDAWIAFAAQGTGALVSAMAGHWIALRETPFTSPSWNLIRYQLRSGAAVFGSRFAAAGMSLVNPIVLSFLVSSPQVGLFSGAERICRSAINLLNPLAQAYYPRIARAVAQSRMEGERSLKSAAKVMIGSSLAISAVLWIGAGTAIRLILGKEFEAAVPALRILALLPPLIAVTNVLGLQWMLALHLDRAYLRAMLLGSLVNVCLLPPLSLVGNLYGMAATAIIAELSVAIIIVFVLQKRDQGPWAVLSLRS